MVADAEGHLRVGSSGQVDEFSRHIDANDPGASTSKSARSTSVATRNVEHIDTLKCRRKKARGVFGDQPVALVADPRPVPVGDGVIPG